MDEFEKMYGDLYTPAPTQPEPTPQQVGGIRRNQGTLGDLGTSLKRGVEGLPGTITGLADLPFALALNARPVSTVADWAGKATGFRPSEWAKQAEQEYSPEYTQAQQAVEQSWNDPNASVLDTAKEYVQHPSLIANQVVESVPSMLLGGAASKGLMLAGRAAGLAANAGLGLRAGAGALERTLARRAIAGLGEGASQEAINAAAAGATDTAAAIAGGAGEGLIQAGQAMDQSEGDNQRKNAVAALGSGVVDAVIGAGAGKVAQKLGLETAETLMAKGFNQKLEEEVKGLAKLGRTGRVAGGAVSEGVLQELPQSAQEQVWQNYADGKPLLEGVARSAVEGALAGGVMGAGANIIGGKTQAAPEVQSTPEQNPIISRIQEHTINNTTQDNVAPSVAPGGKVTFTDTNTGEVVQSNAEDFAKTALNNAIMGDTNAQETGTGVNEGGEGQGATGQETGQLRVRNDVQPGVATGQTEGQEIGGQNGQVQTEGGRGQIASPESIQQAAEEVVPGIIYQGQGNNDFGLHEFRTADGKNFSVAGEPTKDSIKAAHDNLQAKWAKYDPENTLLSVAEASKKIPFSPEQLSTVKISNFNLYGENRFQDINAQEALKMIDEDQSLYEKIKRCVG